MTEPGKILALFPSSERTETFADVWLFYSDIWYQGPGGVCMVYASVRCDVDIWLK